MKIEQPEAKCLRLRAERAEVQIRRVLSFLQLGGQFLQRAGGDERIVRIAKKWIGASKSIGKSLIPRPTVIEVNGLRAILGLSEK